MDTSTIYFGFIARRSWENHIVLFSAKRRIVFQREVLGWTWDVQKWSEGAQCDLQLHVANYCSNYYTTQMAKSGYTGDVHTPSEPQKDSS